MRFAIITDTHIRAPGGDLSSPFPVNEKANGRAEYAVGMIAASNPEFTIHLGDVIHPLPHMPSAAGAAAEAKRILAPLDSSLHFVPGNHDIGDKPSKLMPAGPVDEASIQNYETMIGPQYHSFRQGDIEIVCMNSSLVNSGTEAEREQKEWLEATLHNSDARMKLLFSHYPPFILHSKETDHYDNYAEPGRNWLLTLAAKSGVNAIFSGHVHHFFYNRWRGIPLYCLPATSFTRQDYAELFPIAPASEFGRDDTGKFGVTFVEVSDSSFEINIHNTNGYEGPYAGETPNSPEKNKLIPHLRHAWHLPRALPYNGPMEEFGRKQARNDYPLLRLLQLGIETVRIPGEDLFDSQAKARLQDWLALGRKIVPFCTVENMNDVSEASTAIDEAGNGGIQAIEVHLKMHSNQAEMIEHLKSIKTNHPIWLSAITTSADNPDPNKTFAHSVGSGVYINGLSDLAGIGQNSSATGVVLQVPWEADLQETISRAREFLSGSGLQLVVNLCLRQSNPAQSNYDSPAIAKRIAAATNLGKEENCVIQVDTFEDIDRGYGPRYGMIDRYSNLRQDFL